LLKDNEQIPSGSIRSATTYLLKDNEQIPSGSIRSATTYLLKNNEQIPSGSIRSATTYLRKNNKIGHFPIGRTHAVIPAKAGIQFFFHALDPRFRGG